MTKELTASKKVMRSRAEAKSEAVDMVRREDWAMAKGHTGLEALTSKKKFPLMGQVFLDSSEQCGSWTGWQNLRKLEKN